MLTDAIIKAKSRVAMPIIGDIKIFSPRLNRLLVTDDPVRCARSLAAAGVTALSVVTEPTHFHGTKEILRHIAQVIDLPLLRKDFIKSPEDVRETASLGAQAVLLIASLVERDVLLRMRDEAAKLGVEVVLEVHSEDEIRLVEEMEPEIVGINNKNISQLEIDAGGVETTLRLAQVVSSSRLRISESGIESAEGVRSLKEAGIDAILVGTALLLADDLPGKIRELTLSCG